MQKSHDRKMLCRLCQGQADSFFEMKEQRYYQCRQCSAVMLHPESYVSPENEKERYQEHHNDVEDLRYQQFVEPIVLAVLKKFTPGHQGLDFGSGTGPVITKLLRDKGYSVDLYDPFFCNVPEVLEKKYDFIVCCEVIEHFHFPEKEFKLLRSLLNPGGALICKTDLYSEMIDFKNWYYKNDQTHVFFYHADTLEWIKSRFDFSVLGTDGRLVQFFT